MRPFSMRHEKALTEGSIRVTMIGRLRLRLWQTIRDFDQTVYYQPDPGDSWNERSSTLELTEKELRRVLGLQELTIRDVNSRASVRADVEGFAINGYPSNILDVIEVFYTLLDEKAVARFQRAINDSMLAFKCPWRLADGWFFQVDSEFINQEVLGRAADLMSVARFEGTLEEFREAREDLTNGDTKDAIHKANKSVESALKTILNVGNGTAHDLCQQFEKGGYLDDIPTDARPAVRKVLEGLSLMRHKLAGHGQGCNKVDVTKPYAELAVALAGACNIFVVEQYLRKHPQQTEQIPKTASLAEVDDEIPF